MDSSNLKQVESLPSYRSDSAQIKVSEEKLRKAGEKAARRLQDLRSLQEQARFQEDMELDFNYYHLQAPKKPLPYKGYPNLCCPLPRIGVDTVHANVMFTFGGQQGRFNVLPDYLSKSHMDSADRAAKYLTYVLNYEADMYTALDKADYDAEKYGTGYLEPFYLKEYAYETRTVEEEEVVPEIDALTGEVRRKTVTRRRTRREKVPKFDGVKVKRIDPRCVLASPFFEEVEDAVRQDYVFKMAAYKMRTLEEMAKPADKDTPPFLKPEKVKLLRDMKWNECRDRLEQAKQEYDGNQIDYMVDIMDVELAEVHYWDDMNDDGLSEKVTLVIEAMSGIVLRATFAKCRIVKLCPRPVDGRWHGESIRKATDSFILEWEAIHNARVAKGQWANLPFGFYKAGGRFNPQTLTLMPGKMYPIEGEPPVFPQTGNVDVSYFQEEKLVWDYFERVLALGEAQQGIVSKNESTATESINAQQKAGIRLSNPMNRIAGALNQLCGHIWELNKECASETKQFQVAGIGNGQPIWQELSPNDYQAQVSFKLNMATMFDVQVARDTALMNYQTFIANPLIMNNPASFYELTKLTMKSVGLDVNIPKPEQANVRSPFVSIDMVRAGKEVEPVLGEDTEESVIAYDAFMKGEEFQNWPPDAQERLILLRDKTYAQGRLLAAANLNKSGIFEGMGPMMAQTPGITASRNPTQTFNNLRVEESPKSKQANQSNGMKGGSNGKY